MDRLCGSLDCRRTVGPSTQECADGNPIAPTSVKGHIPTVQRGSSGSSCKETRSEGAQPAAASVSNTSSGAPLRSSPEVSTSAEAAPSSGTEITRRLLMEETRVLSRSDCHREVTSASRDSLRFERGG
jgi:hypothetical protein